MVIFSNTKQFVKLKKILKYSQTKGMYYKVSDNGEGTSSGSIPIEIVTPKSSDSSGESNDVSETNGGSSSGSAGESSPTVRKTVRIY